MKFYICNVHICYCCHHCIVLKFTHDFPVVSCSCFNLLIWLLHLQPAYLNLRLGTMMSYIQTSSPIPNPSPCRFYILAFDRDIVKMMTPSNEPTTSTAITPYRENRSLLDFVMGGTPQETEHHLNTEKNVKRNILILPLKMKTHN